MAACVTAERVVNGQRVGCVLAHVVKDAVWRRGSLLIRLLIRHRATWVSAATENTRHILTEGL